MSRVRGSSNSIVSVLGLAAVEALDAAAYCRCEFLVGEDKFKFTNIRFKVHFTK